MLRVTFLKGHSYSNEDIYLSIGPLTVTAKVALLLVSSQKWDQTYLSTEPVIMPSYVAFLAGFI